MARNFNLKSGFLYLYDWIGALNDLPDEDFGALVKALILRQLCGTPIPSFSNQLATVYARMIEPSIKRRLEGAAAAEQAYLSRQKKAAEKGRTAKAPSSASEAKQSGAELSEENQSDESAPFRGNMGAQGGAARTKKEDFGMGTVGGPPFYMRNGYRSMGMQNVLDVDEFFSASVAASYKDYKPQEVGGPPALDDEATREK